MDGESIKELDQKVVVIADDDIVVRHILSAILLPKYRVILFETGQQCIDYFDMNTADILFLDIQLPDYSGPEVLKILTTKVGEIKPFVISVSANPEAEMRELFSNVAPDAFLEKPFTPEEVMVIIDSHTL